MIPPRRATPCHIQPVGEEGFVRVKTLDGSRDEATLRLYGIEIDPACAALYTEMLTHRLARLPEPPRCIRRSFPGAGTDERRAQVFVLAWKDKSGDVWMDLSHVLLEQGCARVAAESFPERNEYLERLP